MTDILTAVEGAASSVLNFVGAAQPSTDPKNELKLIANGKAISGWTKVRIVRGIERLPMEFDIEATEHFPGATSQVVVRPSDPCQIMIGNDVILTGYVDRMIASIHDGEHTIRIVGRGKCQDLVDCSAEWGGGQIRGTNALDIASKLCSAYGITASALLAVDQLIAIPQFNLIYGETAGSVLERICRYSGLLFYDDVDGNLLLSRVGKVYAGSGFTQGVNIQSATASFSVDQRYTEYDIALQSVDVWTDAGIAGNIKAVQSDGNFSERSDSQPRNRKKIIVCEAGREPEKFAKQRALWERNRRFGRSFAVNLTTDTWRDSNGKLWTPNTLAPITIPYLKLIDQNYVIGEITYMMDQENGRTAQLLLMPPEAFDVQPIQIYPNKLMEAIPRILPPAGNQNPATNIPPPDTSPAVSPLSKSVHNPLSPSEAQAAIVNLYGPDGAVR